jgi:precorrin-2 methylase
MKSYVIIKYLKTTHIALRLRQSNQHIVPGVQALLALAGEACTPIVAVSTPTDDIA